MKFFSSDSHIIEPPDLWTTRIEPRYRDRAPHVERQDGVDWWIIDGARYGSVSGRKNKEGGRAKDAAPVASRGAVLVHSRFEDVREAVWQPEAYVRENLQDGVEISFVLPTQGCVLYGLPDRGLFGAICRGYNDWIGDFCKVVPDRLKGAAMLNVYDVDDAVRELTRAKELGLAAGIISVYPGPEIAYDHPRYEPLWSAAEELGMPLSMHSLTNYNGPYSATFEKMTHSLRANCDHWIRMSVADMIFGGVFERHPKLKIISTEHEGGWVPYLLWQMDWIYERRIVRRGIASKLRRKPSEYFRDHVFVAVIFDRPAIAAREQIGVGNLMWGTDYPHDQSTHPRSREVAAEILSELTPQELDDVCYGNMARVFGVTTPPTSFAAE